MLYIKYIFEALSITTLNTKSIKPRIFQYDFMRAIAILAVIMAHTFTTFANTSLEIETKEYVNTILRFGVVIFIFLAGFFFRREKNITYLRDKILKVIIPYTVISVFATVFLCYIEGWNLSNIAELTFSYIFGYKFGFYFIYIIISLYIIGFVIVKTNLIKHINKLLIASFIIQILWLVFDEFIYQKFHLYERNFFQFQIKEFIFYRSLFTWAFFFILGLWYQEKKSKDLIKNHKLVINLMLIVTFIIYNLQIFFDFGDYTPHGSVIWSIFSTAIIFFLLNLNLTKWKRRNAITYLGKNSFGIFLVHYFFIYFLLEIEEAKNIDFPYVATLIFFPLILFSSIVVVEIVKKVFGKRSMWIIGA